MIEKKNSIIDLSPSAYAQLQISLRLMIFSVMRPSGRNTIENLELQLKPVLIGNVIMLQPPEEPRPQILIRTRNAAQPGALTPKWRQRLRIVSEEAVLRKLWIHGIP